MKMVSKIKNEISMDPMWWNCSAIKAKWYVEPRIIFVNLYPIGFCLIAFAAYLLILFLHVLIYRNAF